MGIDQISGKGSEGSSLEHRLPSEQSVFCKLITESNAMKISLTSLSNLMAKTCKIATNRLGEVRGYATQEIFGRSWVAKLCHPGNVLEDPGWQKKTGGWGACIKSQMGGGPIFKVVGLDRLYRLSASQGTRMRSQKGRGHV